MKIIDCFMYFDEDMMLDIRLNILNKFVSHFIICEAAFNHKGIPKKLNFNINNFSKFKDKISYVVVDKQPDTLRKINENDNIIKKNSKILDNALIRENYQRNCLASKLTGFLDDDLITINDLDEIPNLNKGFAPSESEYESALKVIQTMDKAFEMGLGAVTLGGSEMIDIAMVRHAENTIFRHTAVQAKEAQFRPTEESND